MSTALQSDVFTVVDVSIVVVFCRSFSCLPAAAPTEARSKETFLQFYVQQPMKPLSKECLCRLRIDGISHRDYNPLANKRPLRPSGVSVLISERRNSHISVNRTALSLRTAANEATAKEYSCRDQHTSSLTIRRSLGIAYFIRRTF